MILISVCVVAIVLSPSTTPIVSKPNYDVYETKETVDKKEVDATTIISKSKPLKTPEILAALIESEKVRPNGNK